MPKRGSVGPLAIGRRCPGRPAARPDRRLDPAPGARLLEHGHDWQVRAIGTFMPHIRLLTVHNEGTRTRPRNRRRGRFRSCVLVCPDLFLWHRPERATSSRAGHDDGYDVRQSSRRPSAHLLARPTPLPRSSPPGADAGQVAKDNPTSSLAWATLAERSLADQRRPDRIRVRPGGLPPRARRVASQRLEGARADPLGTRAQPGLPPLPGRAWRRRRRTSGRPTKPSAAARSSPTQIRTPRA